MLTRSGIPQSEILRVNRSSKKRIHRGKFSGDSPAFESGLIFKGAFVLLSRNSLKRRFASGNRVLDALVA
jgi:hypothetical protein